ncbi:hypothetical protein PRBEI_2000253200 [Prionailurus iriomotensis]
MVEGLRYSQRSTSCCDRCSRSAVLGISTDCCCWQVGHIVIALWKCAEQLTIQEQEPTERILEHENEAVVPLHYS